MLFNGQMATCAVAVSLAIGLTLEAPGGAGDPELTLVLVTTVDKPVFVTHAPGDFDRLFVVDQDGRIFVITDGAVLDDPFLDLTAVVETKGAHQGLNALAFHRQYEDNGFLYVAYTAASGGDITLARFEVTADPDVADPDSELRLITIPHDATTHTIGWIAFSPIDGLLYAATGDGGGTYDPGDDAQNLDVLLGKVLRLDVDGDDFPEDPERNYRIPLDNPFAGRDGADEIWAYGLRNPWKCSFDRETGDLYIGDVGQNAWEEVSFQPSDSSGGENYGWDCREAHDCTDRDVSCDCKDPSLVDPIFVYENPAANASAVIGGYVYGGCAISELTGAYIVADYTADLLWRLRHDGQQVTDLQEIQEELDPGDGLKLNGPLSAIGEDAFGELYICEFVSGEIFKIIPAVAGPDCNGNGVSDACDIASGESADINGDGVPDECEVFGDVDGDGSVGSLDLLLLLGAWGRCDDCLDCPADLDDDCNVATSDLLLLLGNWS